MYIYNDYFGYAVLDLAEGVAHAMYKAITGKNKDFITAFHHLESGLVLLPIMQDWEGVDDRPRVASFINNWEFASYDLFEGLQEEGMLTVATLPNGESVLINSAALQMLRQELERDI